MSFQVMRSPATAGWWACWLVAMFFGAPLDIAPAAPSRPVHVHPFGSGVLDGGEIFRGSFSPDGATFYFFKKTRADPEEYRIFVSRRRGEQWTPPDELAVGGNHSNTYPTVSPDGRHLVFASSRPAPGMGEKPNYYLWLATLDGEKWSEARFLPELNEAGYYHSWPSFSTDGRLHFRRTTADWRTNVTMVAAFTDGYVGKPEVDTSIDRCRRAGPNLRVVGGIPAATGGGYLLDVAVPGQPNRPAHSDIWYCATPFRGAVTVTPLPAEINTPEFETFPFFSPDGSDLYFVRAFRTFHRVRLADALFTASPSDRPSGGQGEGLESHTTVLP
jgi:WD40-like Beta Propeller Repeat